MVVFFYFSAMHTVYIIYSPSIDKYYIGETVDAQGRLERHNSKHYEQSYTRQADDWSLKLVLYCEDILHAKRIEKHIKSMKSRVYIENLISYSEMQHKLISRFR